MEFTQTHVHWVSNTIHLILCHPLLLQPSIFPRIRVFANESVLRIRWPKYWSFSISPFNEYSGLIAFRMDWSDLLAVQGTLKSLLQYHSSKASVLEGSAFLYGPTLISIHDYWRTIALARLTFVSKVMSLLFIFYFFGLCFLICCLSSVQFHRSVVSDSLWPHETQHARLPCPSPTPGVNSNMSIKSVVPSSHLIVCHPLLLLLPIPPSIRVFSNVSTLRMR